MVGPVVNASSPMLSIGTGLAACFSSARPEEVRLPSKSIIHADTPP
jgi:hypothetical protein